MDDIMDTEKDSKKIVEITQKFLNSHGIGKIPDSPDTRHAGVAGKDVLEATKQQDYIKRAVPRITEVPNKLLTKHEEQVLDDLKSVDEILSRYLGPLTLTRIELAKEINRYK